MHTIIIHLIFDGCSVCVYTRTAKLLADQRAAMIYETNACIQKTKIEQGLQLFSFSYSKRPDS
jgi:hypothetical protein